MKEIKGLYISLIEDRKMLKWRVNFIKENHIYGFIKPFKRIC